MLSKVNPFLHVNMDRNHHHIIWYQIFLSPDVHSHGFDPSRFGHSGLIQSKYTAFVIYDVSTLFIFHLHFARNPIGLGFRQASLSLPYASSSTTSPYQVIFVAFFFWELFAIRHFVYFISISGHFVNTLFGIREKYLKYLKYLKHHKLSQSRNDWRLNSKPKLSQIPLSFIPKI